jgi:N-acetylmuramoyl-L-alanine amidase
VEDILAKIFLDAGHGGSDSGASGNGLKEKDITLDIVLRIAEGLEVYSNAEVILSRSGDTYPTLDERTKQANNANADCFVSVHINSAPDARARGFESYIFNGTKDAGTNALQNVMHQEIVNAAYKGLEDRGKKAANFAVLRQSKMKAILTENLFISNAADAKLLSDAAFRQKIAQGHINGLEKFLGLKKSAQPPPTAAKMWKVQVGAFEEEAQAKALAADLTKQGYRPWVYQE